MIRKISITVNQPIRSDDPIMKSLIRKKAVKKAIQQGKSADEMVKEGLIK
jgi:hypothetical protein